MARNVLITSEASVIRQQTDDSYNPIRLEGVPEIEGCKPMPDK